MGNMRKSRLSVYKQDRLIEHFVSGSTARTAAALVGVNKSTAAYFFHRLREIIVFEIEQESDEFFDGEIEVDESYFGGRRKGKRGRGAAGKIPVFGLLKRGGRVYTKIIPDASSATLYPIIERKVVRTVSSIRTLGRATTCWMYRLSSTVASIIRSYSLTSRTTLTSLRTSGTRRNVICGSSMVFPRSILGYF
jgi:transposase